MPTPMSIPRPSRALVEAIRAGRAIAIVGSGLSKQAGAPSWDELLLAIAREAKEMHPEQNAAIEAAIEAVRQEKHLDAADVLKEILGFEFHEVIKQAIRSDFVPTECHEILVRIGFRGLITLNYDLLLEQAASRQSIRLPCYSNSDRNFGAALRSGQPFLVKLHGDIDHPDDLVLTRSEYQQLRTESPVFAALAGLFGSSPVLFWVGYGHRDPNLERLRDELLTRRLPTGYAVSTRRAPVIEQMMSTLQVVTAWLQDYSQMEGYLRMLEDLVRGKIIDPSPPKRIHLAYACEDRSKTRDMVQACRSRGYDVRWDQDSLPWNDVDRREGVPVDQSDVVVVYGSVVHYPAPFVRQICERAVSLGKRVVTLLEEGVEPVEMGFATELVRVGRGQPAEALIEHLRPATGVHPEPEPEREVRDLLDDALRANQGIPTDTLTDRIFLTEEAAELIVRAHQASQEAYDPDDRDCFRADLEYARLLRYRGQWQEAAGHVARLAGRAARFPRLDPDLHHLILLEQGALEFERGLIDEGIDKVKRALNHFEGQPQVGPNLIKAFRQLGNMVVEQGDWEGAQELLHSAVYLAHFYHFSLQRRGAQDPAATLLWLDCRRELGSFLARRERIDDGLEQFHRTLREAEHQDLHPLGHHLAGVLCYHIARTHYLYTGDLREAERYLQKALDILERYDNPVRVAFIYEHLARVATKLPPSGNEKLIEAYFERALGIRERTGHTYMTAKTRLGLGDFYFSKGNFPRARAEYESARRICKEHGKKPELAHSLRSLGRAYACEGDNAKAKDLLRGAERLFRELELSKPLREVEFELLKLEVPGLLELSFQELIEHGRSKDYEFCVNEVGEYAVHSFIRKLTSTKPVRPRGRHENLVEVAVGIGDDAAVLRVLDPDRFNVVLTTDAAPGSICRSPAVERGKYAAKFSVVHSLSDLLAMGATPIAILLNLYLKRDAKLEYVMRVVETVHREAAQYGATLIGGDLKERPEQSIGCVGIGLVAKDRVLKRSGARPGQLVAITQAAMDGGPRRIGKRWAQEVLESRHLTRDPQFETFCRENWKEKLLFLPYREMLSAAETGKVRSAIDTSDGVLACLQLLGKESKVSFLLEEEHIEELVDPEVREVARHLGIPASQFLFNAGHDWEIVLTVAAEDFEMVRAAIKGETRGDLARLGKVIPRTDEVPSGGVAYRRRSGEHLWIPYFTDEKFVRRPYEERSFEWEDLKFYIEGGRPLSHLDG